jgi:signal transduction histidine kinase
MQAIGNYSSSSSFKVGVLFTSLLMLGVFVIAYFMVLTNDQILIEETAAAINADMQSFREAETLGGIEFVHEKLQLRLSDPESSFFYALNTPQGKLDLANIPAWPQGSVEPVKDDIFKIEVSQEDAANALKSARPLRRHFRMLAKISILNSGHRLLIGRDIDDLEIAQWLVRTLGWLMIAILIVISGLSMWIGYYVVNRINRIADTADNIITTGNLSERLPVDSSWDDLSKLSVALNRVLDELEELVNGIKSVSENIAHDLRTPLAVLRGDIEGVADPTRRAKLLSEVDKILDIFNGLLRIADIESEKQKRAFTKNPVDLIAQDAIDLYSPLAEDKHITIIAQIEPCELFSDRDLLFQAFANVLDNAIKFTPDKGSVGVKLSTTQNELVFSVCDTGIGIEESDRELVIRRFFRVDKSRSTAGNGLGMALVAAVAKLHRGRLAFADNPRSNSLPGLCCTLLFPCGENA